ncbi:response regulator transcription factor [Polynucleobacter sp. MWH-Spelu-300-X4]|uniref:response regulator transcription factor n=1 Tax=Polynucleobacter sp. MWH-Spelu-300-X4 TaxID=2689109 RepID=UPI00203CB4A0|nr:response regulator [Polynucleobacter sp. MWH-Spelu-300-X4]
MNSLGHIYVVEDDESMRSSLARMLKTYGYTADIYASPEEFLEKSVPVSPAAILLDMRMPSMSGVDLQKRLVDMGRITPIIFISGESMSHEIVTGMKQGAVDFLFKPFNLDEMLLALTNAVAKDRENFKKIGQSLSLRQRYESLTPRETEVCALLVDGLMNKDIAVELGTTNATIKVHKARVMEKMQADSLQDLVRYMIALNE